LSHALGLSRPRAKSNSPLDSIKPELGLHKMLWFFLACREPAVR
jgi:hypothetical protein